MQVSISFILINDNIITGLDGVAYAASNNEGFFSFNLLLREVAYSCYTGGTPAVCSYVFFTFLKNGAAT